MKKGPDKGPISSVMHMVMVVVVVVVVVMMMVMVLITSKSRSCDGQGKKCSEDIGERLHGILPSCSANNSRLAETRVLHTGFAIQVHGNIEILTGGCSRAVQIVGSSKFAKHHNANARNAAPQGRTFVSNSA
jgi:hypothetical protein